MAARPVAVSKAFGDGFWTLIPFTMQMALVAIGGYIVAVSAPAGFVLKRLAAIPASGRSAIVMVGILSIFLSLINWGLSLIFSGLFVREIARRNDIRMDYRAAGAAAYLGLGGWLCSRYYISAAQLQANAASIPAALLPITGVIGFSNTILTWQNGVMIIVVITLSAIICYVTAPDDRHVRTAQDLGVALDGDTLDVGKPERPGTFSNSGPILTIFVVVLALG